MTDNSTQIIADFVASGGKLREWEEGGYRHRLRVEKSALVGEVFLNRRWQDADPECPEYAHASIILRQLQEDCAAAGVEINGHHGRYTITNSIRGGGWTGTEWGFGRFSRHEPAVDVKVYATRHEAMIAAKVAIEQAHKAEKGQEE